MIRSYNAFFVQIVGKDNTHIEIDTPYKIDSNYAILSSFPDSAGIFEKILRRICHFHELNNFYDIGAVYNDGSKHARSAEIGYNLLKRLGPSMERIYDDSERSEETSSLLYFANKAVLLGFLWAKAEDEKNVKPNALAALEAMKKSKSGGERAARPDGRKLTKAGSQSQRKWR